MPKEWIEKLKGERLHTRGENNYRWISDRTKLKKSEKKHEDVQYKIWMKSVKVRDEWRCRMFGENCEGGLEAHHILNWVDFPDLRYEIKNGITLCHAHHPRGRAAEKRLQSEFQALVSASKATI